MTLKSISCKDNFLEECFLIVNSLNESQINVYLPNFNVNTDMPSCIQFYFDDYFKENIYYINEKPSFADISVNFLITQCLLCDYENIHYTSSPCIDGMYFSSFLTFDLNYNLNFRSLIYIDQDNSSQNYIDYLSMRKSKGVNIPALIIARNSKCPLDYKNVDVIVCDFKFNNFKIEFSKYIKFKMKTLK